MIVVNAACAAGDFAALRERLPQSVALTDLSAVTAKVDLQGPESVGVLEAALNENFHDLPYFGFRETTFDGAPLLVSRTGYTGELGFELYLPWDKAESFWTALLKDERVKPVGLGARDTLRLEAGLPLYGHDLDDKHSPAEAGMGRMLTSTADYVGKEGAQRVREVLVPLRIEGRRSARHGDVLALPGRPGSGPGDQRFLCALAGLRHRFCLGGRGSGRTCGFRGPHGPQRTGGPPRGSAFLQRRHGPQKIAVGAEPLPAQGF